MTPSTAIALIGIDWGSTHCRAFRFNSEGHVSATHHGDSDVGTLAGGDFPGALQRLVGDWLNADASAPLLLCGMVGSKQGWLDVPYVAAPAAVTAVAACLHP